ncbi:hypothetical protein D3C80_1864480 [compost metagenome]
MLYFICTRRQSNLGVEQNIVGITQVAGNSQCLFRGQLANQLTTGAGDDFDHDLAGFFVRGEFQVTL